MPKIIDNFLDDETYEKYKFIIEKELPFYPCVGKVSEREIDKFQFVHNFIEDNQSLSNWDYMPLEILRSEKLSCYQNIHPLRAKLNCGAITKEHEASEYHIDLNTETSHIKEYMTAIYYLNGNNGYTEFEDGTKIETVSNRIVIFDGLKKHRGVSQTDTTFRYVINLNFIEQKGETNA